MITSLPIGTFFSFKYKGQIDYGKVCVWNGQLAYESVDFSQIPKGSTIFKCIWKNDEVLESRGKTIK